MNSDTDASTMRDFATQVVKRLREASHIAYFAGGCVRDSMLGIEPKDFDVATDATPEQVRNVFGHRRTLAIGASFGVITVLGPKPNQVEVATFRNDGEYTDGRHPDGVTFSTAEEDAARRDFTINGMFFDPIEKQVIDFVHGQSDLEAKLIRAIGDPAARIEEDRLRMLRAVRFAAIYGFAIEPDTMSAVQSNAAQITDVSQERITAEITRMLEHKNRARALTLLHDSKLLEFVFPKLHQLARSESSKWQRLLVLLGNVHVSSFQVTLAMLLGRDGVAFDKNSVDKFCRGMKLSNELRQSIVWTVANREKLERADQRPFSAVQALLVHDSVQDALSVMRAVADVDGSSASAVDRCDAYLLLDADQLNPPPLVRGDDLKELGISPGPRFKEMLDCLRVAQLDGEITNKGDAVAMLRGRFADLFE